MEFEWDNEKNLANIKNHNIDFETAARVFGDPFRLEKYDKYHSDNEDRFITIGEINGTTFVIMVVFTDRGNVTRIISARKATSLERKKYYENKKKYRP